MGKKCGCDPTRKDGGIDYRYKKVLIELQLKEKEIKKEERNNFLLISNFYNQLNIIYILLNASIFSTLTLFQIVSF